MGMINRMNVSRFIKEHIPLCVCTLGVAILGYFGYHAVRWIINKCQKTEKIDQVAQKNLSVLLEKSSFSSNHITLPSHDPLPKISNSPLLMSEKAQKAEISLTSELENQKRVAAVKIQSAYRGYAARLTLKRLQFERRKEEKSKAAIKIQSVYRGHLARVEVEKVREHILSYDLFQKAKPYVNNPSNLQGVPRAANGKTRVYLPKELPIALKMSGFPGNQMRFDKMRQARDICKKSGYKHLVIPKARVYGNFIVESRLPIATHRTKEHIGFYIENREQFTNAVEEFTGFLCQSSFYDITGGDHRDPYVTLSKTPLGRYDNIPLYIEENQGKIGLIDLERFFPGCSKQQEAWCFFRCCDAVHLFPYHFEEIMNVAKKFDSNIEAFRENLEQERDETLKRFKIAYENHLDFVRGKGITLENPTAFERLNSLRLEEVKKVIATEILKEKDMVWFREFLGEKPDETLICFNEKAFPKILDMVYNIINYILKYNLESEKKPLSTNLQLLSIRTLTFSTGHVRYKEFIKSAPKLIEIFADEDEAEGITGLVLDIILKELERGKEIAYYNPSFGPGGYAKRCIFC